MAGWRNFFVGRVYSDHNRKTASVIRRVFDRLDSRSVALAVGEAGRRLHPRCINLDIISAPGVDCRADAALLPFADQVFDVVVTRETLEHVAEPDRAMGEISRVLKPGGSLYCQLPFTIGYHPGPTDFWRFSRQGIRQLVERSGLTVEKIDVSVGPAVGFYRISVEFIATLAGSIWHRLYMPTKGAAALSLYPIKWLDRLMSRSPEIDRIAGGYYVIARK